MKYKDYADYLKSPKWKQVKQDYRDNESVEFCTLCHDVLSSENPPNYHHYKYSKDWNKDTWENLIIVCKPCHDLLHDYIKHDSDKISLREYISEAIYHARFDKEVNKDESKNLEDFIRNSAYEDFIHLLIKYSDIEVSFESDVYDLLKEPEKVSLQYAKYQGTIDFRVYKSIHDKVMEMVKVRGLSDEF